jgi:hypothetical protein
MLLVLDYLYTLARLYENLTAFTLLLHLRDLLHQGVFGMEL